MIIIMKAHATADEIKKIRDKVENAGFAPHTIEGVERTVIGAVGNEQGREALMSQVGTLGGVERVVPILKPYKLASNEVRQQTSEISINGVVIGGKKLCIMAGPCSVESEEQIVETAKAVKDAGAHMLRGGAYKPRTSPYSFQGLGLEGLKLLDIARKETGLPVITEVMNPRDIDEVHQWTDILQVGARNVQNFSMLKELGRCEKPVFLKRGLATTIKEWLMSAEYIMSEGNHEVILCERGIRTFETATRNTLDLNAIPVLREETHLPVIVDPSHGTGYWQYVQPMALAGIACGADGLMIEVHPDPAHAASDGGQSLKPKRFVTLMEKLKPIAEAVGRTL